MKPNFALTLSSERIGLLHRISRGWLPVGEVATDSPDLAAQLSWLRSTALELSPQGITTKLILPNDQILFTEILAPGPDAGQRRRQIRRALEGRTPYKLDELAFDWWGTGDRVQVAVVARETLEEAETFAVEHRFNPVSFVAIPPTPAFAGEPFFGTTKGAREIVGPGESVSRDQDPVRIISREAAADAAPAPASVRESAGAVADRSAAPAPVNAAEPPASPDAAASEKPAQPEPGTAPPPEPPSAAAEPAAEPRAEPASEPRAEPAAAAPSGPGTGDSPEGPARETAVVPAGTEAAAATAPEPVPAPGLQPVASPPGSAPAPATAEAAPAAAARPPAAQPVAREEARAAGEPPSAIVSAIAAIRARSASERAGPGARAADVADGGDKTHPAAPPAPPPEGAAVAAAAPTFTSRRRDESAGLSRSAFPPVSPAAEPTAASFATEAAPPRSPPPPAAPPRAGLAAVPPPVGRASGAGTPMTPPLPRPLPPAGSPPRGAAGKPAAPVAARLAGRPSSEAATAASAATLPPGRSAAGVAGGLGTRTVRQRGKPRYLGLVLTGALLLFLVLVATWSSLILVQDGGPAEPAADPVALADAGGDPASDTGGPEAGALDPEYEADLAAMGQSAAPATADLAPEDPAGTDLATLSAPQDGAADPEAEAIAAELSGETVGPAADVGAEPPAGPEPALAGTAAGAEAPPAADRPAPQVAADRSGAIAAPQEAGQAEILLSRADDAPAAVDPLVLPPPAAADLPPPVPMPPPPAGTTYAFDAEGRLVAPPGGVVTPDGVWLIAARPPVVPPQRPEPPEAAPLPETAAEAATDSLSPGTAETAAGEAGVAPAVPGSDAVAGSGFVPDPAASALRPRARPARPAPQQAEDDAGLMPATDTRLAVLRPLARPAAILAAAAAAAPATGAEGASIFAAAAPADAANPMAVVWSRRPAPRPQDFQAAVEAAVAAAVRPRDPVPAPEPDAAPAGRPAAGLSPEELAEDDGSEEPAAAPRIPTSASVAREATFANAINLSKINLIGIYGTPSKRTALIRLANGRYVKVGVGDRVDGGRVAAITASEVRYQKGGRLLTLAMPRG